MGPASSPGQKAPSSTSSKMAGTPRNARWYAAIDSWDAITRSYLLWRTASALFPDDYAETYGFGLLPNSFDFGFGGGEEPPIGDDPLAPPEDFDPLDPATPPD